MPNDTHFYPFEFVDRMLLAAQEEHVGEMVLHLDMTFDRMLDEQRLRRALALLATQHPIISCRPHRRGFGVVWMPDNVPPPLRLARTDGDVQRFYNAPLRPFDTPAMEACLSPHVAGCRLVLRVSHLICDAAGVRHLSSDLGRIYTRLKTHPHHLPPAGISGSRAIWTVLKQVTLKQHIQIARRTCRLVWGELRPRHTATLPLPDHTQEACQSVVHHIPAERVTSLVTYGRRHGATLNDLFVCGWYRALLRMVPEAKNRDLRLQITVDLRPRYLPTRRHNMVCNWSSFDYPFLYRDPGDSFEETLERVVTFTRRAKQNCMGMTLFPLAPVAAMLPYSLLRRVVRLWIRMSTLRNRIAPGFTNMGAIDPQSVTFDTTATDAFLRLSPIHPPLFALGISGFDGRLTLSFGVPDVAIPLMNTFCETLLDELP